MPRGPLVIPVFPFLGNLPGALGPLRMCLENTVRGEGRWNDRKALTWDKWLELVSEGLSTSRGIVTETDGDKVGRSPLPLPCSELSEAKLGQRGQSPPRSLKQFYQWNKQEWRLETELYYNEMAEHGLLFRCLLPFAFHFLKQHGSFYITLQFIKAHPRSLSFAFADLYILTLRGPGSFILNMKFNSSSF